MRTKSRLVRAAFNLAVVAAFALGCDADATPGRPKPGVPQAPQLEPGMALLRGAVTDLQGNAIAGAAVVVLETGAQTSTGDDGRWELMVAAASTVTVRAEATGFAPALAGAVILASGQTSAGHDLALVTSARLDALAQLGGPPGTGRGVIAVTIQSMSGACHPEGGLLMLEPSAFGRIVYAQPDADATPEPSLTAMQTASARVGAWIVGVVPPGAYYTLRFAKPGCNPLPFPVDVTESSHTGQLAIQAGAVSHAIVFTE